MATGEDRQRAGYIDVTPKEAKERLLWFVQFQDLRLHQY